MKILFKMFSEYFIFFCTDIEAEVDSPIPPTPPRKQATPEPEIISNSPEVEEVEDPLPKTTSKIEESSKSNNGTKRRIRKRKAVNKTYMDDQGFMGIIMFNVEGLFKIFI